METKSFDVQVGQTTSLDIARLEGIVTKLQAEGHKLVLTIRDGDNEKHEVDLPLRVDNEFELIPYELALLDQRVGYKQSESTTPGRLHGVFERSKELEIHSGPLKGRVYREEKHL